MILFWRGAAEAALEYNVLLIKLITGARISHAKR